MKTDEKLAEELVWAQDGHLSEVAATVAADGQEQLLPAGAAAHLATCESCMRRVGEAAMLSMQIGEQLMQRVAAPAVLAPVRLPLPKAAIAAALFLAALGALPALSNAPVRLVQLWSTLMSVAPHIVRGGLALANAGTDAVGPALWTVSVLSVLVLFIAGLAIARAVPRSSMIRSVQRGGG